MASSQHNCEWMATFLSPKWQHSKLKRLADGGHISRKSKLITQESCANPTLIILYYVVSFYSFWTFEGPNEILYPLVKSLSSNRRLVEMESEEGGSSMNTDYGRSTPISHPLRAYFFMWVFFLRVSGIGGGPR